MKKERKQIKNKVEFIKKLIDELEITKKDLPFYGIKCAMFSSNFYDAKKYPKEYKEIYNYLFERFEKLK